jgi:hypothetical protein
MTTKANLAKYFNTCRTYTFVGATANGVRVRFVFHNGASMVVFATNEQIEEHC